MPEATKPPRKAAHKIEAGQRVFLGEGRATALVVDTEHDGNMVALRLREDGTRALWVGMKRSTLLTLAPAIPEAAPAPAPVEAAPEVEGEEDA